MRIHNWSIGTRLALSFAVMLSLAAAMTGVGVWRLRVLDEQVSSIMDVPLAKERLFEEWYRSVAVGVMRYTAIAKSADRTLEAQFAPEVKVSTARGNEIQRLLEEMPKTPEEIQHLKAVAETRKKYLDARGQLGTAAREGREADTARLLDDEFRPAAKMLLASMQALIDYQHKHIEGLRQEVQSETRAAQWQLGAMCAVAMVLGVGFAWLATVSVTRPLAQAVETAHRVAQGDLTMPPVPQGRDEVARLMQALHDMTLGLRTLVSQVRQATQNISTASHEIASGNMDLSERTEHAASNLQETASSMEELTATVQNSANSAREASAIAVDASVVARRGGEAMADVVSTMNDIRVGSQRIAEIITVIDGIAFQTNILALNAAVEAARAGEQGRGFAVVAGEVRALAQRSATASKEIRTLIGSSVEQVEGGVRRVDSAGATIQEIVSAVSRVAQIIEEISVATSQQSQGLGQVNVAVSELDRVTQQNAALVEEASAAATSMNDQSQQLAELVGKFRLNVA